MPIVEQILVSFYMKAVENPDESEKKGRPVYSDREYIELQPVGDNKTMVARPVQQKDKIKYPDLYDAFVNNKPMELNGTILAAWPLMTPALIKNLEHYEVYTVENVAELDDAACSRIGMGMLKMRDQARAFIDTAADNAFEQRLAAEKERAEAERDALQAELNDLGDAFRAFKQEMADGGKVDAEKEAAAKAQAAPPDAPEAGAQSEKPKRGRGRPKRSAPQAA